MSEPTPPPAMPPATPVEAVKPTITYDDFAKLQLRVGIVLEASPMEKSKKLLKLLVDLGDEKRTVLAGMKEHYTPEEMLGKQIVVVANLAPRPMMGEVSHGMLMATTDSATGKVILISPLLPVAAGSEVK